MQRHLLLLAGFLLLTSSGWAAPVPPADTTVAYLDKYHAPLPSAVGAALVLKTVPTSGAAGVQYTYSPDGWLLSRGEYSDLRSHQQQGVYEEYYEHSHQVRVVSHYQQNKLTGELLSYHPTGQLKRREQYLDYVSKGGECFDVNGQPTAFVPYLVMAEYPGGLPALLRFVVKNVRYSRAERKLGHEGRPVVDFIVDEHGQVQGAHVREPGFAGLDAEALRVVQAMPAWQPARIEGVSDIMHFSLPISFSIQ